MKYYGILSSPVLGLKQDYPTILLGEAFSSDCKDVIYEDGYVKKSQKESEIV